MYTSSLQVELNTICTEMNGKAINMYNAQFNTSSACKNVCETLCNDIITSTMYTLTHNTAAEMNEREK